MTKIKLKEVLKKDIKSDWDALVLSHTLKDNLERSVIWPVENLDEPRDHGFILFGPPGTGKTTIPYSIAKKLDWRLFYISPKDFITENNSLEFSIKQVFEVISSEYSKIKKKVDEAKAKGKSIKGDAKIIFVLDEIDELVTIRGSDSDKQSRLMTTMMLPLLNDLREDAEKYGFIFFALTNHINRFDPAIIRKGRFDLILPVGLPNRLMRHQFFEIMISKFKKDYLKKFSVAIYDWTIDGNRDFYPLVDLALLSNVSQRLSFGDIETICKRVIEEQLAKEEREFHDFLQTKKKNKSPYTVYLTNLQFLRWINKYLVSNTKNNDDLDRYYQDLSIYTRGSSPHTELHQIQPTISEEFESLHVFATLNPPYDGWKLNKKNTLICEIRNLSETDRFDGKLKISLTGPGISRKLPNTDLRLTPLNREHSFVKVTPTGKGILNLKFEISGTFSIKELKSLDKESATLKGAITKTISLKIE